MNEFSDRKILIVDDIPENIEVLAETLSGYKRLIANNGKKAIEIAKKSLPDLILLDIMMPVMDGFEVIKKLKKDKTTRDIPVIFVTAKDSIEDEIKGLELGAVDFIGKPISPPVVQARVRNHLELKISRERLEIQNKELIEAAKLKEDIDGVMRHDLKGPLVSMIGFPPLILMHTDSCLQDAHKHYLLLIEQAAKKMLKMINSTLDMFKMERGSYTLNPQKFNVANLLGGIVKEIESELLDKQLKVNFFINGKLSSFEKSSVLLNAEEFLCYSMFMNLIKNSVEASPNNEVIEININRNKSISITNKGEVPVEIRNMFWNKFATSGKIGGTGLGTYSAYLVAKTHKADIKADFSKKGFTTIKITFK